MNLFKDFRIFWAITLIGFCGVPIFEAQARDISGRVGIGYVNDYANHTPCFSIKYGMSRDTALQADLGVSTAIPTSYVFGGKFFKNIFLEQNINFYGAFGLAALKSATNPGFEGQGVLGAEFYIPGIESIGFSFEAGASAMNVINNTFIAQTIGFTFINAGMHFYL